MRRTAFCLATRGVSRYAGGLVTRSFSLALLVCRGLCGGIAGCAEPAVVPAASANVEPALSSERHAIGAFASTTESPQAAPTLSADPDLRTLSAACGDSDLALLAVAQRLTKEQGESATELDVDAIGYELRAAGAPYVWPRAWLFSGSEGEVDAAKTRMQRWLVGFSDGGVRRCGVALLHQAGGRIRVGALAVDVLADLEPLPTQVRVGQWLDVRATLRVPASDAKVVILGPQGAPHSVPTSFSDGQVLARFNADQPGTWLVQLLAGVAGGPRPLLEALVFAGVDPPSELAVAKAPGEDAAHFISEPSAALYAMIDAARHSERLPALTRDARLESLARAHAEAMRRARKTAHDAGDGDLNQRLEQEGLALAAGENVAHAGSAALAARALWSSPSHRENLLFPRFDLVGVGVALDRDGTLWVCQVFGTSDTR